MTKVRSSSAVPAEGLSAVSAQPTSRPRTRKRLASTLSVVAATIALAGCASSSGGGSGSGGVSIAFANFTEQVPIFHTIHTTTDSLIKKANVKVRWYNNNGDSATMLSNARLMAQSKPDAIIEYPVSPDSAGLGSVLKQAGVPCVSVDLPTPGCTSLDVVADAYGKQAAQAMAAAAKERGWSAANTTLLLGQNAAAGQTGNLAVQNFYATIAPLLGYKPLTPSQITPSSTKLDRNAIQFDGQSALQPAYKAVTALLAGVPKTQHIILFTLNDESTVGALRAIDAQGKKDDVIVLGVGASPDAVKLLKTDSRWIGEIDVLSPFWGEYAIATAEQLAAGKKVEGKTPTQLPLPYIVMDKKSVEKYYPGSATAAVELPPLSGALTYLAGAPVLDEIANVAK